jgi:hypothetical protein
VVVIVPFVGVQLTWSLSRPTSTLTDGRHGIEQRLEKAAVVDVRGAEQKCQRHPARVHEDVALGAGLAAVGRIGTDALAPFFSPGTMRCRASSG